MKTTVDLPEDLAAEVQRRAAGKNRGLAAEVVELLRRGLEATSPSADPVRELSPAVISIDPETGLPVILSPPDAPVRRMSPAQVQAIIDRSLLEEDLEREGISVRF